MFLLDTNVISELRRPDRADAGVLRWARSQSARDFYLSAITVLEIEIGILLVLRKDPAQSAHLRTWNDEFLPRFSDRILAVDADVARRCAPMHVPDHRSERDAFIAATALVHGLIVVTRNIKDFEPTGVVTFNPWGFDGDGT